MGSGELLMSIVVKNSLADFQKIIFGPFIGELGWEIYRWAGFVRKYKRLNPHKTIIVCTRSSRQDLYIDAVDFIEVFDIDNDYVEFQPDCYDSNITDGMYKKIVEAVKDRHPNAFMFEPRVYKSHRNVLDVADMEFNFTPRKENTNIIEDILNIGDKNRIPIVVPSRERKDMKKRNWGDNNWNTFFKLVDNSKRFIVFVAGTDGSYYKPSYHYMYSLEDFVRPDNAVSTVGLTIEAMKHSKLTIGPQTASIILSNLLGTPTIFWGHEIIRHKIKENPYKTECKALLDRNYSINPVLIFNELKQFIR